MSFNKIIQSSNTDSIVDFNESRDETLRIEVEFTRLPDGYQMDVWLVPFNRLIRWLLLKIGAKTGIVTNLKTRKIKK